VHNIIFDIPGIIITGSISSRDHEVHYIR